jgi:hypothetical protein
MQNSTSRPSRSRLHVQPSTLLLTLLLICTCPCNLIRFTLHEEAQECSEIAPLHLSLQRAVALVITTIHCIQVITETWQCRTWTWEIGAVLLSAGRGIVMDKRGCRRGWGGACRGTQGDLFVVVAFCKGVSFIADLAPTRELPGGLRLFFCVCVFTLFSFGVDDG